MKKTKKYLILINVIILIGYINYSIYAKEKIINEGSLILLKLAPVDPRSLMQGDYMILNYGLRIRENQKFNKTGYCVVKIDKNNVAKVIRLQPEKTPLREGEKIIKYHAPDRWNLNIGAESFFFEEGQGEKFEKAEYGGIKVDKNGNSILIGLYDKKAKRIE